MPAFVRSAVFPALFKAACPGAVFSFQDISFSVPQAAEELLPILMTQALETSRVMGGLPGLRIEKSPATRTGTHAFFDDAPPCLLLPFLLDALALVREASHATYSHNGGVIPMEHIMPPILPSFDLVRPESPESFAPQDVHQPE